MFNKKKKETFLTATQSFIIEMLRAILEHALNTERIYLTQTQFTRRNFYEVKMGKIDTRPYAISCLSVDVEAYFTSLNFERRHGREGVLPVLPFVKATFEFTNEATGWYNWELHRTTVDVEDFYPPNETAKVAWAFEADIREAQAPCHLLILAEELQHRGPSRLSVDQ